MKPAKQIEKSSRHTSWNSLWVLGDKDLCNITTSLWHVSAFTPSFLPLVCVQALLMNERSSVGVSFNIHPQRCQAKSSPFKCALPLSRKPTFSPGGTSASGCIPLFFPTEYSWFSSMPPCELNKTHCWPLHFYPHNATNSQARTRSSQQQDKAWCMASHKGQGRETSFQTAVPFTVTNYAIQSGIIYFSRLGGCCWGKRWLKFQPPNLIFVLVIPWTPGQET